MILSITTGGISLMLLGFCSVSGGLSVVNKNRFERVSNSVDDHIPNSFAALTGGYGML